MKKKRSYIIFVLFIILAGLPSYAGDFAYLTSYLPGKPAQLLQMDATNEAILKRIDLPDDESLGDMVIDEKGGCFLSSYRLVDRYGRNIFYYDPEKGKMEKFINLGDVFGPSQMIISGKYLIVAVEGNDRTQKKSGILFIDRKKKTIEKEIFPKDDDPNYIQYNILDTYYDGSKYLTLSTFNVVTEEYPGQYIGERVAVGDIVLVDVKSREVAKIIHVPKMHTSLSGVCIVGDKIYIAAESKGIARPESERNPDGGHTPNPDLLEYSLSSGTLETIIKISPHPFDLAYDKANKKLFVLHSSDRKPRDTVEIIDVKTDKIIATLEAPTQLRASMVAPNKMYLSIGDIYWEKPKKPKLLVIDTRKNRIINEIDGMYQDISLNQKY